jgi:benzoylformate decarboxylase
MTNRITGRSAFIALMKDEGITHLFGNPGTTELPIMHALVDHPDMTFVLALHEALVVSMADGFSRASGRLTACNVHVAPGLGNAMGSLFNAAFTSTPLILTAGQQEQGFGLMEPNLYGPLVQMAEPLVKWAVEVNRLADLPRIIRRAAKIATTPPTGPVFISLPGDILNQEDAIDLGQSARIVTRNVPAAEPIGQLADLILAAERPVLVCGDELVRSDALKEAGLLAETLGAPAYQSSSSYGAHFLSEHPCYIGALPKLQKVTRQILEPHDLMIVLGSDVLRMAVYSPEDPMPAGLKHVQIGLDDREMGKNYAPTLALSADPRETIRALIPVLEAKGGAALKARAKAGTAALATRNWTEKRKALAAKIETAGAVAEGTADTINPDWLTLKLVDALPRDAMLVFESLTTGRHTTDLFAYRDRFAYHGLASGGIGFSIPSSIGMSLAQPGRRVVTYVGDGSAMYSIQALWTAAHLKLPITFVICSNGGYRIIKQRLLAFHGNRNFNGMSFEKPEIDYAAMAASMGVTSERITKAEAFEPAMARALRHDGPVLLDVVVDGRV